MIKSLLISSFIVLAVSGCFYSCGSNVAINQENNDVLVTVGDSSLTVRDVLLRMPSGLTPEDSLALFSRIVEEWVRDLVLTQYAEDNIADMDKIDRMVESYRKNLIVNQYLQIMSQGSSKQISDERIKEYYDANHSSLILEQPLVKGIFVRADENDVSLPEIRKLVGKADNKSLDELEKSSIKKGILYKSFNNDWIEWNVIAELIPHRFENADELLKTKKYSEYNIDGDIYILRITQYVPSGSEMPLEFAKFKIAEILQSSDMMAFRQKLLSDIYKNQIQKGKLTPGLFDPLTGQIKKSNNNQK